MVKRLAYCLMITIALQGMDRSIELSSSSHVPENDQTMQKIIHVLKVSHSYLGDKTSNSQWQMRCKDLISKKIIDLVTPSTMSSRLSVKILDDRQLLKNCAVFLDTIARVKDEQNISLSNQKLTNNLGLLIRGMRARINYHKNNNGGGILKSCGGILKSLCKNSSHCVCSCLFLGIIILTHNGFISGRDPSQGGDLICPDKID